MVVAAAIAVPMAKQKLAGLSALAGLPGSSPGAADPVDPEAEANMARLQKILDDAAKQQAGQE
jgi:hypothetical protein